MTECCLLHCFRPATFQRLLDDAMSAKEIAANSRQKKIDRLTAYAAAYPNKIEVLNNNILIKTIGGFIIIFFLAAKEKDRSSYHAKFAFKEQTKQTHDTYRSDNNYDSNLNAI
jgi:hypothetical protein